MTDARPSPSRPWAGSLQRALREETDRAVIERAVAQGLLTEAQLAEARAAHDETGEPLLPLLQRRGWLSATDAAALHQGVVTADFLRNEAPRSTTLPAEVRAVAADPTRRIDEFILVAPVGRGATGEVWKAWDGTLSRWVAIKLSHHFLGSAAARERFQREATAAARLRHPHIAPIHRVGIDGERAFLVMPFIDGQTLERATFATEKAVAIMATVARAVHHAHEQGVLHRDLKPGNLIVDRQGSVFVLDFGLAYLREEPSHGLTQPGELVGTAGFMSPEQARGAAASRLVTADVYGLGATLYFLITGQAPFRGDSLAETVRKILEENPAPPRRLRPELDPRLERILLKALANSPLKKAFIRRRVPAGRLLGGSGVRGEMEHRLPRESRFGSQGDSRAGARRPRRRPGQPAAPGGTAACPRRSICASAAQG